MKFAGNLRSKISERKVLRGFGVLVWWTRSDYLSNTFEFAILYQHWVLGWLQH
jgi:hypothetical protein